MRDADKVPQEQDVPFLDVDYTRDLDELPIGAVRDAIFAALRGVFARREEEWLPRGEQHLPFDDARDYVTALLAGDVHAVFATTPEHGIIGLALLELPASFSGGGLHAADLLLLWVDADLRREGVGTQLLYEAEKVARDLVETEDDPRLQLLVHGEELGALAFYHAQGFKVAATLPDTWRRKTGERLFDLLLSKTISE